MPSTHCLTNASEPQHGAHFVLPPIELPGGLQCDAYGLIWQSQRRATFAHLWMILVEGEDMNGEHDRCDILHHPYGRISQLRPGRTIEWWKAQCIFINVPIGGLNTTYELQRSLRNHLLAGGEFSESLMNCEAQAIITFRHAVSSIEEIISATQVGYVHPLPQPVFSELGECVQLRFNPKANTERLDA